MDQLYTPRKGVEFRTRKHSPFLQIDNSVFVAALFHLVNDWLHGKVGCGGPTEEWERMYIEEVNQSENVTTESRKYIDKPNNFMKLVYKELIYVNVLSHLKNVTSHRKWLRLSLDFLEKIGISITDKLTHLVQVHDLSKYTHREVLGYAIMFGDGSLDWRRLEKEAEIMEWDNTLHNHYAGNPHHPEYFYPLNEDGSRDKSVSMLELDNMNGKYFLEESLIDMLAARGERTMAVDKIFNIYKWFDIPEKYMLRYSDQDKSYVNECLDQYRTFAKEYFAIDGNASGFTGFFDTDGRSKRNVVFQEYDTESYST